MIPFIGNSEIGRLNLQWQKVVRRLPGAGAGAGVTGEGLRELLGVEVLPVSVLERVTLVAHICQNLQWCTSNGCVSVRVNYTLVKFVLILNKHFCCLTKSSKVDRSKTNRRELCLARHIEVFVLFSTPTPIFSFGKKLVFIICTNGGEQ